MESEPMSTPIPRENSPLLEAQSRIEPVTLHHEGQQAQHTNNWTILAPKTNQKNKTTQNPTQEHNAISNHTIPRDNSKHMHARAHTHTQRNGHEV